MRVLTGRLFGIPTTRVDGLRFSTSPRTVQWNIRKALYNRTYEAPERSLVRTALRPDDRVLEIGACAGVVSVVCAAIVGPQRLLSYEANPQMEPLIRRNFSLNKMVPNLRMKAVTIDGRNVSLRVNRRPFLSTVRADPGGLSVPSDAMPVVVSQFRPTVIVIDVEGSEIELLGEHDLPGVTKIVAELHPHLVGEGPTNALLARLKGIGFAVSATEQQTVFLTRT